jgi:hypothetical protein
LPPVSSAAPPPSYLPGPPPGLFFSQRIIIENSSKIGLGIIFTKFISDLLQISITENNGHFIDKHEIMSVSKRPSLVEILVIEIVVQTENFDKASNNFFIENQYG